MLDTNAQVTHEAFAEIVGVSRVAVTRFVERGVLKEGGTLGEWLLAYCERLREQAAGRYSESGISLTDERALLSRVQRERIELELAARRHELVSVDILAVVLSTVGRLAAKILEGVPARLRRELGSSREVLEIVERELVLAREEIGTLELPFELIEQELARLEAK
jgi:phage terminase Nu1 subunit (DNA packaging protein)